MGACPDSVREETAKNCNLSARVVTARFYARFYRGSSAALRGVSQGLPLAERGKWGRLAAPMRRGDVRNQLRPKLTFSGLERPNARILMLKEDAITFLFTPVASRVCGTAQRSGRMLRFAHLPLHYPETGPGVSGLGRSRTLKVAGKAVISDRCSNLFIFETVRSLKSCS
ncbi:hypothetical protein VTI74DRAFT_8040 [Chaetomium olivicolor]